MSKEEKDKLWESWSYEFQEWIKKLRSVPVRLVVSYDKSESYDMDRLHVFELENGQYAVITECGCSCYSASDADVDLFPEQGMAVQKAEEWRKQHEERGY